MGMKRRYLAVLMGIMVATTSVPAMVYAEDSKTETAADAANDESGEADASDENGDESQENVVLGEVKSVSDSEITIAVGTMKEMGQPGRRQFQLLWCRSCCSGNRWYCLCERWQRDYRCSRWSRAFCIW